MSFMFRGKEIFKPLNTGRIDERVSCIREYVANIYFYTKDGYTIMIDAGYNYDRLAEKMRWLDIRPESINEIIITHQDTDHVGAIEVDSQGLFKRAKIYVGRVENDYLEGRVRRKEEDYFYKNIEEDGYLYLMSIDEDYYPDNLLNGNYPFNYGKLYIYYKEKDKEDNVDVIAGFWQYS